MTWMNKIRSRILTPKVLGNISFRQTVSMGTQTEPSQQLPSTPIKHGCAVQAPARLTKGFSTGLAEMTLVVKAAARRRSEEICML